MARVSDTWKAHKKTAKLGARVHLPSLEEIYVLSRNNMLRVNIFYFLDNSFAEQLYGISTTVLEAVEYIGDMIGLENFQAYSIFEGVQEVDDHLVLEDNRYISDILVDFGTSSRRDMGTQKLLFKKKQTFGESDDAKMDIRFLKLTFVQAQHDFLQGLYPVVKEDAAQLCALQLYSKYGSALPRNENQMIKDVEKFTSKEMKISRSREDWKEHVVQKHSRLPVRSSEEAEYCFLTLIKELSYRSPMHFHVNRLDDPIGLFPSKLILGVNKRGVHFFQRPIR